MTRYSSLVRAVMDRARASRYCLHLYGSFVVQPETARDIDVAMISPEFAKAKLVSFPFDDGVRTVPCNLYCVPQEHFEEDCHMLAYGGFYAQKYAFCFDLLNCSGDVPDAAGYYWQSQARRCWHYEGVSVDAAQLIRKVHQEIFEMNPTVGRSLCKFLGSPVAAERLRGSVQEFLDGRHEQSGAGGHHEWRAACQAAMYKFWSEYRKHKDGAAGWSQAVRAKMSLSLVEADANLIAEYIGTTD